MISYKDRAFCDSDVEEHTCGREFTEEDSLTLLHGFIKKTQKIEKKELQTANKRLKISQKQYADK